MIRRATMDDLDLVNTVMRHPEVYPWISDDSCPKADEFTAGLALANKGVYFLTDGIGIVFMVHPWNTVCYEVHTCIVPESRGRIAVKGGKEAQGWMFDNTPCVKLVTQVPVINRVAALFAKWCGWHEMGINRASFLKDGVLHDQKLLGLCKGEWICRQQP